jgi:hypothetical protein
MDLRPRFCLSPPAQFRKGGMTAQLTVQHKNCPKLSKF